VDGPLHRSDRGAGCSIQAGWRYNAAMTWREFSLSDNFPSPERTIDSDAPLSLRNELVDVLFSLADSTHGKLTPQEVYEIVSGSLGETPSANPYGGLRKGTSGRLVNQNDWRRVYDVVLRFVPEFRRRSQFGPYREAVNRILAANHVVWELDETGRLVRVAPPPLQSQIRAAIEELSDPRFASALELLNLARDAYDNRPRRDRDACTNAFDAMEATAKVVYGLQDGTFGDALNEAQRRNHLYRFVLSQLQQLNALRNNQLGHGTTDPFALSAAEVDFVFFTCVAGIRLFASLRG